MKSVFVFNVEQQVHKFEADIKRLYKECNKIVEKGNIKDIKETLTENDSICTVGMSANKAMLDKLKSISVDFPLICDRNEIAYKQQVKLKILFKATDIYNKQEKGVKPNPKEIEELLLKIGQLDYEFGMDMRVFGILRE